MHPPLLQLSCYLSDWQAGTHTSASWLCSETAVIRRSFGYWITVVGQWLNIIFGNIGLFILGGQALKVHC